jgi:hypothetical protein
MYARRYEKKTIYYYYYLLLSALGGGGQVSASYDSTWARLGRDPQFTSFFYMAH